MKKPTVRLPRLARGAAVGLAGAGLLGTSIALAATQGAGAAGAVTTTTPIKHLVVLFDENVSYDHYFGTYPNATNADGVPFTAAAGTPANKNLTSDNAITDNANSVKPFRLTSAQAATCSQNHNYNPEQQAMDWDATTGKALMDLFPQKTSKDSCTGLFGTTGLTMGYYDGNTVTAEWNYAQNYAMSDNSWADNFGPSTVGALNVVSGQTYGGTAYDSTSDDTNPSPASTPTASGFSAVNATTGVGTVIGDPDPVYDDCANNDHTGSSNLVGMQGKNIGDLLNEKGVTWGWFQGGFAPTTPYAGAGTYAKCDSKHLNLAGSTVTDYSPHHNPFAYYKSTSNPHHLAPSSDAMIGRTDQANHQYDLTDFDTALQQDNLPAVSYVKADAYQDGHPSNSNPIDEQHFLTRTINEIQQSPSWSSTAIVIAYDDSDGWYDHVAPTILNGSNTADDAAICTAAATSADPLGGQQDRCGPSQRLPFLVISPFAKQNYVDHNRIGQSSVVKFIEQNWGLGQIGDGSFDANAGTIDSFFDFQHPQQRAVVLKSDGAVSTIKPVKVAPAGGFTVALGTGSTKATYGKAAALAVTATSDGDVTGGTVSATIDGKAGPSVLLNGTSGTLKLPATLAVGSHTVKLDYTGSANTQAATKTVKVTVAKAPVSLTAHAARARHGKVVVTVTVAEPGSTIKPTGTVKATHGTTAAVRNGLAHVTVSVHKGKRVHVVLTFKGSNYQTVTRSITVKG